MKKTVQKQSIGSKVRKLLLKSVCITILLVGGISMASLYSVRQISTENSRKLGQTAADDAETALEEQAANNLQDIAVEKAAYIEEKFAAVEAYVLGIAAQAEAIYQNPQQYPDREVAPPVPDSTKLAAQLLQSESLDTAMEDDTPERAELLKLGNIQDLLVQYNAQNNMVSSTYLATESGWMIQADYIAFSKYKNTQSLLPYEASSRQWYSRAKEVPSGEVVYTDVLRDINEGGDCIVCASPVYYNNAVVAVAGVGSYLETVNNAVLNTSIGEAGYAFLVNQKGQVMVSGKADGETAAYAEQDRDLRKSENVELAAAVSDMVFGESSSVMITLDGREVYLAYAPLRRLGWSFATVIDVAEVLEPAKESQQMILSLTENAAVRQHAEIRKMQIFFVGIFAAAMLFISLFGTLFSKRITEPIRCLTQEVTKIDGGNLDCRIQLATGDEVEDLGNAFNSMTAQIQQYIANFAVITGEKERIRTEIQLASKLQKDMLPKVEGVFANCREFSLAASMVPAKGIGGDFYDFFLLDENHLVLVMADVSGKGIPAALFMVEAKTIIRGHITANVPLEQAVKEINNSLCANNENGMFVTAWIGVLTLSTGELYFVNAGHCHPLIIHSDGNSAYNTAIGGLVLAGIEETAYHQAKICLCKNDTLLLYTDGVTEATSKDKVLYGEKRLKSAAESKIFPDMDNPLPEELLKKLWMDVDHFQKETEQFDDITMLALTYRNNGFRKRTAKAEIKCIQEFAAFIDAVLNENKITENQIANKQETKSQEEKKQRKQISKKTAVKIQMAADEILSNICKYSRADMLTMGICVDQEKAEIILYFEDNGVLYNPLEKPDPNIEELLEKSTPGGLGIYLVKKRMDSLEYEYTGGKNRLTVRKAIE